MRGLQGGHDALQARAQLEGGDSLGVGHGDVLDPLDVSQEGVLGADPRVVETGRDGVRGEDLAVFVLEQVRVAPVEHSGPPA